MNKANYLLFFSVVMLLSSCFNTQQAFYFSPKHANSTNYKAQPMLSDSISSANYASVMLSGGASNDDLKDGNFLLQGNFHRTMQWSRFQAFYGAGFSAGFYEVTTYPFFGGNDIDTDWINERAGKKFHGAYGLQGGINYAKPLPKGEWRMLGVEVNMQNEFGDYYRFRREMPESGANIVDRSSFYSNFTVFTDLMRRFSDGSVIGYKLAFNQSFRRLTGRISNFPISGIPKYMTHTIHITMNRWTGYGQLNFGSDAFSLQYGMVRRLHFTKKFAKAEIN